MRDHKVGSTIRRGVSRRTVLAAGGAALASGTISGFPFVNSVARASGAPLTFWQFYAPGGPVPSQVEWFERTIADWNDSHDQKIELEYVPNKDYINGTRLTTSFASGDGPDLFLLSPGEFLRYYNGGILQDLSPAIAPDALADFPDNVVASRMVDGKVYAVPMEVEPMAMYYSVQAFEEAGMNEADVPKTWYELLDIGKRLTTADRYGLLFQTQPGYYQNFTWYPFLWQGGGDIQRDGKSTFDSPATVQALKLWQDAVASGASPRQALGNGANDTIANLASGYCAIQNVGIWGISQLRAKAPDFRFGVFRLPTPANGSYVTVGGGWAFAANARGKNPEVAAEFCAWALASMDGGSIDRVVQWCTKGKSDMPPRNTALEAGRATFEDGIFGTFSREIYPGTRAEPRVPPQAYKIISDAIQQAQLAGADPATVAANASAQLDAFLASYSGAPIV